LGCDEADEEDEEEEEEEDEDVVSETTPTPLFFKETALRSASCTRKPCILLFFFLFDAASSDVVG
tara:strand:+ start:1775 stop:1969 length:195 start_codon:yes stop_codon:yes gene_type:complete